MSAFASAVSTSSSSNVSQELPPYHFSAEEVQDDCQVQPSFHRNKSFHRKIFDYLPTLCIGFPGIQIVRHLYLDNDRRFIDPWPYLNSQRYQVLVHGFT